ncbi:Gfo/Idh/MocA family oxidoreductase [Lentibacillus sediminis]|uniref:Gfo/Idh/MocA family protein n=1 Tax=Lentibacillus sediminis TaxID=1940529 RepID=UPI000C1C1D6D|nr:Gfo/Idh/MocA family oxidoreductase [Lentibacillus sediminis]
MSDLLLNQRNIVRKKEMIVKTGVWRNVGALGTHMIDCLRWMTQSEVEFVNGLLHTHVPQGAGETRDADDAFFIHGKMDNDTTFSVQLVSGVNHGLGSSIDVFGSEGTITLKNDKQLSFGRINEPLQKIEIPSHEAVPSHLSKEASAYYPAFHPFLEMIYDYIINDQADKDLPTIEDGHENQVIMDKI